DVLVQVQHEVVGHDRIAGGEERDQALDQVALGWRHLPSQVTDVRRKVDLLDGPRVFDGSPVHLEKLRIHHRTQRQTESGIEEPVGTSYGAHWQASQVSGFSREQLMAAVSHSTCV